MPRKKSTKKEEAVESTEEVTEEVAAEETVEETPEPVKKESTKKSASKSASQPSGIIGNARDTGSCRVAGIELAAKGQDGDSVELTVEQKQDQNLMQKIVRNVGAGLLEWR